MSVINLHVSCSSTSIRSERRFDKGTTIATLKVGAASRGLATGLFAPCANRLCDRQTRPAGAALMDIASNAGYRRGILHRRRLAHAWQDATQRRLNASPLCCCGANSACQPPRDLSPRLCQQGRQKPPHQPTLRPHHPPTRHDHVFSVSTPNKPQTPNPKQGKLEMLVGAAAAQMRLELYDREEKKVCDLDDDEAMLGRYPVEDYFRIHVVDLNPSATVGQFEDVSKVEKFELTDEEYSKRTDTVMAFKKRNKLGRFDPERAAAMAKKEEEQEHEGEEDAKAINKGDRCEVTIPGTGGPRRGMVMYKGGWAGLFTIHPRFRRG